MKRFIKWSNKILPAFVACLTMVLTISANSSGCFLLNQPEEPEAINRFKKIN